MLIVLEGPDCAGKTTLAENLAEATTAEYLHHGAPERDPLEEWGGVVDHYEPGRQQHVVIDRLHWGELVYAPLYRGKSQLGIDGWRTINEYLRRKGALHVLVTADRATIEQRVDDWHEPSRWTEKIGEVTDLYEWVFRLANQDFLPVIRLDTTNYWPSPSARAFLCEVAGHLERAVAA